MLVSQQNWMTGYSDGTFGPEKEVTRAELAQVLMNVKQWSAAAKKSFPDVIGHWAEDAVAAGKQQGLLSGYPDGTFHPDAPITRSETIVIFNKVLDHHPWKIKVSPIWPSTCVVSCGTWN